MRSMLKISQCFSIKAPFYLAIIFLFYVINCEAALPKRGEHIKVSGTISHISSDFAMMQLDPAIDTGNIGWPKCDEALLKIKIEESGGTILNSLFDEGEIVRNVPIKVYNEGELGRIRGYLDPAWINNRAQVKLAQRRDKERAETKEKEIALKEKAKIELEETQAKMRKAEEEKRLQAEIQWQEAQARMRKQEEEEKIREQRIADLKSGKMKITTIEDAKLAFSPISDDKYTFGLPIDGLKNTGEYYLWSGTISWKSGKMYFCLDGGLDNTKCFGFTNIIVRFSEMRENSRVTVIGKLAGETEVTLVNKLSGFKESKKVAFLTDCYVF